MMFYMLHAIMCCAFSPCRRRKITECTVIHAEGAIISNRANSSIDYQMFSQYMPTEIRLGTVMYLQANFHCGNTIIL